MRRSSSEAAWCFATSSLAGAAPPKVVLRTRHWPARADHTHSRFISCCSIASVSPQSGTTKTADSVCHGACGHPGRLCTSRHNHPISRLLGLPACATLRMSAQSLVARSTLTRWLPRNAISIARGCQALFCEVRQRVPGTPHSAGRLPSHSTHGTSNFAIKFHKAWRFWKYHLFDRNRSRAIASRQETTRRPPRP